MRRRIVFLLGIVMLLCAGGAAEARQQAAGPPLVFNVPGRLPGVTAGEPYTYLFCRPRPLHGVCGSLKQASQNPRGGQGAPYAFSLKWAGFKPSGLTISNRTGIFTGTVRKETRARDYPFTICAFSLRGNAPSTCHRTVLPVAAAPDTTPPAAPSGLGAKGGARQVVLDWADNSEEDLAGYRVYRDGAQVATTAGSAYTDANLGEYETHGYTVSAYDKAGNQSGQSGEAKATTDPPDFSGTYRGTWGGTYNAADGCVIPQGGGATFAVSKSGTGYSVTMTLQGYKYSWSLATCEKSNLGDGVSTRSATFVDGKLVGPDFSITGNTLSGGWNRSVSVGGSETVSFTATRG